nr:MBL fold metallo-hydrolase [Spelaeicoccus albus]
MTVIGCAGSYPGPESPASCYLVETTDEAGRNWRIALDFGSGALGALQRFANPNELDAVLLTHLHPDHCLDLTGMFVYARYAPDGARQGKLPVYAPPGAAERLGAAYFTAPGAAPGRHEEPGSSDLNTVYTFTDWSDRTEFRVGPLRVTPFLVDHPVEAYGLRLEDAAGHVVAYSGDTDECDALRDAAAGADLLLCEAAFHEGRDEVRGIHMTGYRAGSVAADAGARRLVLTHIPAWNDPQRTSAGAARRFSGPIDLAATGAVYTTEGVS